MPAKKKFKKQIEKKDLFLQSVFIVKQKLFLLIKNMWFYQSFCQTEEEYFQEREVEFVPNIKERWLVRFKEQDFWPCYHSNPI